MGLGWGPLTYNFKTSSGDSNVQPEWKPQLTAVSVREF